MGLYDIFSGNETIGDIATNQLLLRGLFGIAIIIIGFIVGWLVDLGLTKLSKKWDIEKHIKGGFIDLTIFIIKLSIYILFINLGIDQIGIPAITNSFSKVLLTIPTFTFGLLILIIGFALASFLRRAIKSSETASWEFLSQLVFYFVLLVFGVYAVRIALMSVPEIRDTITLILIAICSAGIIYSIAKKNNTN